MNLMRLTIGAASVLALSACAVPPPAGPQVMALPGAGKSFPAFQQDDGMCRQYAANQSNGAAGSVAATNNAVGTAMVGTALGAGLGAALGSLSGQAGAGAVVGGTMGLLAGGASAAGGAQASAAGLQQQYDMLYTQCMYAQGNSVQNPPGGYPVGAAAPYGVAPAVVVGAPAVVVGTGWGWRGGYNGYRYGNYYHGGYYRH